MNISLKLEEEELIQAKLKSGKYETAYDVIVEALRLLEERDKQYEKWLEETREKVAVGINAEIEPTLRGVIYLTQVASYLHKGM